MKLRDDSFTFEGRVLGETQHGALLITDGTVKCPVPRTWVTLDPEAAPFNTPRRITMARSLARQKGFCQDPDTRQKELKL